MSKTFLKARGSLFFMISLFMTIAVYSQSSTSVNISAGGLSSVLTSVQKQNTTNLTIVGTVDARDFLCMRDSMPNLESVDISQTSIASYTGSGGTNGKTLNVYNANWVPVKAFQNKIKFKTIILPQSATKLDDNSFDSSGLLSINLPHIYIIGVQAFRNCYSLKSIFINPILMGIGTYAFINCSSLSNFTVYSYLPLDFGTSTNIFTGIPSTCVLYVPDGFQSAYQSASQWNQFKNIQAIPLISFSDQASNGWNAATLTTSLVKYTGANDTIAANINISSFGAQTNFNETELRQGGITLKPNSTYTLTFLAKGSGLFHVAFYNNNFTNLIGSSPFYQEYTLTSTWKQFTFHLNPKAQIMNQDSTCGLSFQFGAQTGNYYITNCVLLNDSSLDSVNDNLKNKDDIYLYNGTIYSKNAGLTTNIEIYNMLGQLVRSGQMINGQFTVGSLNKQTIVVRYINSQGGVQSRLLLNY